MPGARKNSWRPKSQSCQGLAWPTACSNYVLRARHLGAGEDIWQNATRSQFSTSAISKQFWCTFGSLKKICWLHKKKKYLVLSMHMVKYIAQYTLHISLLYILPNLLCLPSMILDFEMVSWAWYILSPIPPNFLSGPEFHGTQRPQWRRLKSEGGTVLDALEMSWPKRHHVACASMCFLMHIVARCRYSRLNGSYHVCNRRESSLDDQLL